MKSSGIVVSGSVFRLKSALILGAALHVSAILIGVLAGPAAAGQTTIAWDPNMEPDIAGYKLYYRTASGTYGAPISVGNVTSYVLTGLADGQTYYIAVTAVDSFENESGYSSETAYSTPGVAEIDLLGNSASILNGDSTPAAADFTFFGKTNVAGGSVKATYTIRNTGTAALTLTGKPLVAVGGANAADFKVVTLPASSVAAGGSTTFQVRFDPSAAGARNATLTIGNSDADENPYTFAIQGTGVTGVVSIGATVATATEAGPTAAQFTVTRTGATFGALKVALSIGGSATPGGDYASIGDSVTIPAGAASAPIAVTPINDTAVEGNETVVATLIAGAEYTLGTPSAATATIGSDDLGIGVSPACVVSTTSRKLSIAVAGGPGNPGDTVQMFREGSATRQNIWYLNGTKTLPATGLSSATFNIWVTDTIANYTFKLVDGVTGSPVYTSGTVMVAASCASTLGDSPTRPEIDLVGNATGIANGATTPAGTALSSATAGETISRPAAPSGPTAVAAGEANTYFAKGAICGSGDRVQYQFNWSDGTTSEWLPAGVVEATKSWAAAGTYTQVQVQARCASHPLVTSAASASLTVTVGPAAVVETITRPGTPVGATSVAAMAPSTFKTGGAVSSSGDALQYRFLWSDGTTSDWLAVGVLEASKSWSLPGSYEVRVEARCARHPSIVSPSASPLMVKVSPGIDESLSEPALPVGSGEGQTGVLYAFDAGGAASSEGDAVQYRFQWGDGTTSDWGAAGEAARMRAWKFWPEAGTYSVTTEARCSVHPDLTISSAPADVQIVRGDPELFFDTFDVPTTFGGTLWRVVSGGWLVSQDATLSSQSEGQGNIAVAETVPDFTAGRITARVKLIAGSRSGSAGIIFSHTDAEHYRYVGVTDTYLYLGQVGDSDSETDGVKASVQRPVAFDTWHQLRVDVQPDGVVNAYLGQSEAPALTFRFTDPVGGQVGVAANTALAVFDDFGIWDERVLLP